MERGFSQLKIIQEKNRNSQSWKNRNLYRLLYHQDLYHWVSQFVFFRPQNPHKTKIVPLIENLVTQLRKESFQFVIRADNNRLCLGSRLVLLVVSKVLLAIYSSPQPFVPWTSSSPLVTWKTLIERLEQWPEIHALFQGKWQVDWDKQMQHTLIEQLSERIEDERFISLLWKFFKKVPARPGEPAYAAEITTFYDICEGILLASMISNAKAHQKPENTLLLQHGEFLLTSQSQVADGFECTLLSTVKHSYQQRVGFTIKRVALAPNKKFACWQLMIHCKKGLAQPQDRYRLQASVPSQPVLAWLQQRGFCHKNAHGVYQAKEKKSYISRSLQEIFAHYNQVWQELEELYQLAYWRRGQRSVGHVLRKSLAQTLAAKYRSSVRKIYQTWGRDLVITTYENGEKRTYSFGGTNERENE